MLKTAYYPVGPSTDLSGDPLPVSLLGNEIVVFRDQSGRPVALSNRCAHQFARMEDGKVTDGCLTCPNHHWRFDNQGHCTSIPGDPDFSIPANFRVRSFPTQEKSGLVWVFTGDAAGLEKAPPIPDIPDLDDPGLRGIYLRLDWQSEYLPTVENFLDFLHVPYVHRNSIGKGALGGVPRHDVTPGHWSASTSLVVPLCEGMAPLWNLMPHDDAEKLEYKEVECHLPGVTRFHFRVGGVKTTIWGAAQPVSERHTIVHTFHFRNYGLDSAGDESTRERLASVLEEDRLSVERIYRGNSEPLATPSEILLTTYRQQMKAAAAELGWHRW